MVSVAVVSPYALDEHGGVQTQVVELAAWLREAGHRAWAVGPGRVGPPQARLLPGRVRLPANGARAPISLHPGVGKALREAVRGADVVHVHEPLTPAVSLLATLRRGLPTVGTFHADPSRLMRALLDVVSPVTRRVLSRLDVAVAVSRTAAAAVERFLPDLEVIPNGVDVSAFNVEGPEIEGRVAFLGRDDPRKGLGLLLEAWPEVRRQVPRAELYVMGPQRQPVEGVFFTGPVDESEKRSGLASASIYCAPNTGGESFGITLVEAMAAGCVVVASDLPAFRDVLGGEGRLVPPGRPDELAAALVGLLESSDLAQLARRSVARAASFDWNSIIPVYEDCYMRAMDRWS